MSTEGQLGDQVQQGLNWTPYLLIQYNDFDTGMRALAPGTDFWQSPGIVVESSDPFGNPVVGEQNFVHAFIWNLGIATAAPVEVSFYWANPSLGFGAADCNLIGREWLQIPTRTCADVRCNTPWVPVEVNGGHECLMVNCTNYIMDPIRYPFQPQLDRHPGQHNVHVVSASAAETVILKLNVSNLFPIAAPVDVTAHVEQLSLDLSGNENVPGRDSIRRVLAYGAANTDPVAELTTRYRAGSAEARRARRMVRGWPPQEPTAAKGIRSVTSERGAPAVRASFEGESRFVVRPNPGEYLANLLRAADTLSSAACSNAGQQLRVAQSPLQPFEQRTLALEVTVPAGSLPDDFLVCKFAQTSQGMTIGGYTLVVHVTAA